MSNLFSPLIERAMRLAADAHRHQTRKASDVPYFYHPASVMLILSRAGLTDEEVLAAAVLHDVIEDTDCTEKQLRQEFGERVVSLVLETSEQKEDRAGKKRSWQDRKRDHIQVVANASLDARAIVLADKLHNLGTMTLDFAADPDTFWTRFNASQTEIVWYHEEMLAAAAGNDPKLQSLATNGQELLAQLRVD